MVDVSDALRRRAMQTLFAGVALGTTSFVVSITVSPLAAAEITSRTSLTGLPWTAGVLGTGLGSALVSRAMARRGRRYGLITAYAWGLVGAALALEAIVVGSLPLLVVGTLVFGFGNSANHLARYAASDLYAPERRGSALGTVAWAGTVGGVIGPSLLAPSGRLAEAIGLPELSGAFVVTLVGFAMALLAYVLFFRTDEPCDEPVPIREGRSLFHSPRVQIAAVSLAAAQVVMVMIMTMTPVHIRSHGHSLGIVGIVLSAHVFGMYGLSPVSGRLADRFGSARVAIAGFALMVAAAVSGALTPAHAGAALAGPLFLLGLGWSFSYVGGSALLASGLSYADRAKLQGTTDALVWTSAAAGSLSSGVIVAGTGYVGLCVVASLLVVIPVAIISARRRTIAPAAA